jgi:cysteinyl-tRNA synthetase
MIRISILFLLLFTFFGCSKQKRSDKKGIEMKAFIKDISSYSKGKKTDFIVIPQNGIELVYNDYDAESGIDYSYLEAIDGVGIEELFYNDAPSDLDERIATLNSIKADVKVMVSDFVGSQSNVTDAISKNLGEDFLCYPRVPNNYDYEYVTTPIINENSNEINSLNDAQNYIYLISYSQYNSKTEIIEALRQTNFDVILMEFFFDTDISFTASEIELLKTKANGASRKVISYINIGAAEKYRYYWQENWRLHNPRWLKKPYDGYEDEIWVKFWKKDWENIIYKNENSYLDKIIESGFDGIYLDNIEAYYFLYYD